MASTARLGLLLLAFRGYGKAAILVNNLDKNLILVWNADSVLSGPLNIEAQQLRKILDVFLLFLWQTVNLDALHAFILWKLLTAARPSRKFDLVAVDFQVLIDKHFKLFLVSEVAYLSASHVLHVRARSFIHQLPEPLIDLIFFQVKIDSQLSSQTSRWNLPFMHFKDLQKYLHLLRLLPRPIPILVLGANLFGDIRLSNVAVATSYVAELVMHLRLLFSLDLL